MSTQAQRAIAAMQQEIADLRRRVGELEHAHDPAEDALLSAIAARFGSAAFSAADVETLAALD